MWNQFNKKDEPKYHFDFDSLYNLFQYLITDKSKVSVLVDGLPEESEMIWYEFPASYQTREDTDFVTKNGFNNFYELLNVVYEKIPLAQVDIETSIEKDLQYDFMVFNIYATPPIEMKEFLRSVKHSFYIVFVYEVGSDVLNGYRVLYSNDMAYGVDDLYKAKLLTDLNHSSAGQEPIVAILEKTLAAFAQETKVNIHPLILEKYPDALVSKDVSIQDVQDLLKWMNISSLKNAQEKAVEIFNEFQKTRKEQIDNLEEKKRLEDEDYEFYDDGFSPLRFELLDEENFWNSDWKFDPEDIEYFISSLLKEDWTFDYPDETYSHDLFPYIQSKLAEKGLVLMNMDTLGDEYIFFLVKQENVASLLQLSYKFRLGLERLD